MSHDYPLMFKLSQEHSLGSKKFPNQNLMQIGQGIQEVLGVSQKMTVARRLESLKVVFELFIYLWHLVINLLSLHVYDYLNNNQKMLC